MQCVVLLDSVVSKFPGAMRVLTFFIHNPKDKQYNLCVVQKLPVQTEYTALSNTTMESTESVFD